jgi:tetratricopeptide (TPR) repeat protein
MSTTQLTDNPDAAAEWRQLNDRCLAQTFDGEYAQAISNGNRAMILATEAFGDNSIELADSAKNLATAYMYSRGPAMVAASLGNQAYDIAVQHTKQHPDLVASIIHQYAVILQALGDTDNAERFYNQALEVRREHHISPHIIAKSLGDVARLYADTGRAEEERQTSLESQKLLADFLKDNKSASKDRLLEARYDHAIISSNLGLAAAAHGDYELAGRHYNQAATSLIQYIETTKHVPQVFLKSLLGSIEKLQQLSEGQAEPMQELGARLRQAGGEV